MQDGVEAVPVPGEAKGARDLQAQLYRKIGISAVAAAVHSINKPEPAAISPDRTKTPQGFGVRAA